MSSALAEAQLGDAKRKRAPAEMKVLAETEEAASEDYQADEQDENDSDLEPTPSPKKKRKSTGSSGGKSTDGKSSKGKSSIARLGDPSKADADSATKFLKTIKSQINSQMVYRKSLKRGKSRVSAEVPNLLIGQVQAILGTSLLCKATNGARQISVQADDNDIEDRFGGHCFSKSLRYGACLALTQGLKFVYNKEEKLLKVTGMFTMLK